MANMLETTISNFLQCLHFHWNVTEICSKGPTDNKISFGLGGDALAPKRQQAITGINIDQNLWGYLAPLVHNELTHVGLVKHILMDKCKTAVSPLLMHWRYCSLALSHWYAVCISAVGSKLGYLSLCLVARWYQTITWTDADLWS